MGQGLVGGGLEFDDLAAAVAAIGGDHGCGAGVLDAVLQRLRGKAAKHHRVNGADARAGLHGNRRFGHHGHIDDYAVAAADAGGFQTVGELAHLVMQFGIGDVPSVTRLAFENDGGFVGQHRQMAINAVVGHIQCAVEKPTEVGGLGAIQGFFKLGLPGDVFPCLCRPEPFVILFSVLVQLLKLFRANGCGFGELGRGLKQTGFSQNGFNILCCHVTGSPSQD